MKVGDQKNPPPIVTTEVVSILDWPTETAHVFHAAGGGDTTTPELPHTVLVFVPGNPGCIGWYVPNLIELVTRLGRGFAARGLSYAGHGTSDEIVNVEQWLHAPERDTAIPWTVDGQIQHKIAYMDNVVISEWRELSKKYNTHSNQQQQNHVLSDSNMLSSSSSSSSASPRFIFLAHSIGAHMVQRLCILRPDILQQTDLLLHLMPYTRMKAPQLQQKLLKWGASHPNILIGVGKTLLSLLKALPQESVDSLMKSTFEDQEGRDLAVRLVRQPTFARNFFELGTEEIRDVPIDVDHFALRCIGKQCPMAMLYCGEDHWAPEFHQDDLKELQRQNLIPQNIYLTYMPEARHDYVSNDKMVPLVMNWCYESIQQILGVAVLPARSRL